MTDERASRTRRRPARDDEPLDPEQAEALSRAAREAVRQPADPRLERSFAHLGLVPEPDEPAPAAATPRRARSRRAPAPLAAPTPASDQATTADVGAHEQALIDAVATWQRSTDELRRRLDILMWLLAVVTVLIGVLAVVLIVRGPG